MKRIGAVLLSLSIVGGCSANVEDSNSDDYPSAIGVEAQVEEEAEAQVEEEAEKFVLEPLSEPWPAEITRDALIGAALYEAFESFDEMRVESCPINHYVYLPDTFHDDHVDLTESFSRDVVNLFCNDLHKDIYVVGGKHEYVLETIAAEALPSDPHGGVCGVPVGEDMSADWFVRCAYDGDIAWIGSSIGTVRFGEAMKDDWATAAAIHEVIHLVQDQQFSGGEQATPPRPHPRFRPVWLIEGGAEFLADSVAKYLGIQDYQWTTPTDRSGGRIGLDVTSDLEVFEWWASPSLGPVDYYVGQVASEYLVASAGFDAYMDIFRRMDANEGDFDKSFEEAIGISLEDFYGKFEVMHSNLYDKKVIGGE